MTVSQVAVVGIAGGTFALLARPRLGDVPLSRSVTSAAGAVLVVALGLLSPDAALASLDATTLLLLFGMLCHVEALRRSGCYEWAGAVIVRRTATARQLTLGALGLSAALSAVALNDATVLLLTPVLVTATREADVDATVPLLAVVLGANVGSLATPLGNPQNAFVLARSGVTTAAFVAALLPVTLVALCLTALALAAVSERAAVTESVERPSLDVRWALGSGAFVLGTLLLLAVVPTGRPGLVAASMGIAHVAWLQGYRRVPGTKVLQAVDWNVLVMFAGIFVLVGALRNAGLAGVLADAARRLSLAGVTFVLSNLVSNVPAVVLLAPATKSTTDWFVLAAVSTLAGSATPIGSAATLIVLDRARREDVTVSFRRLFGIGFCVSVVTAFVAVAVLGGL